MDTGTCGRDLRSGPAVGAGGGQAGDFGQNALDLIFGGATENTTFYITPTTTGT
jgi:hypothetical protein